jgi:hypothetical protein
MQADFYLRRRRRGKEAGTKPANNGRDATAGRPERNHGDGIHHGDTEKGWRTATAKIKTKTAAEKHPRSRAAARK